MAGRDRPTPIWAAELHVVTGGGLPDDETRDEDFGFDELGEDGFPDVSDDDSSPIEPGWRRPLLIAVAALTAVALAIVPVYNAFFTQDVADNGLEVCGFDYCIVEAAVREEGLELVMSGLYNKVLDDGEAIEFARLLTDHLGVEPVGLIVVDDLEGRIGGVYDPVTRSIEVERPARAWTVIHEVAHAIETGHGMDFQEVVIELTRTTNGE